MWSKYIKTNFDFSRARERLVILLLGGGLLLFLVAQFYVWPAVARMKDLSQTIPKRQEDLTKILKLRDEFFDLQDKMAWINTQLKKRGSDFELLTFLEELAKKCGIENKIVSMRPLNQSSGLPDELTVEMDIDGLLTEELTKYLYEIENSGKLLCIRKTTIRSNFGQEKFLNLSLYVSTLIEKP